VSRFGWRVITALAIWLGLAILGQGSRASASFLTTVTPVPQSAPEAEGCGAAGGPTEFQSRSDMPLFADVFGILQVDGCGAQRPAGSGAGSSSSTSSGSTGCVVMLMSVEDVNGPTFSARLRARDALSIPDPLAAAILEPPRAGC
jgi:hypothetical protein